MDWGPDQEPYPGPAYVPTVYFDSFPQYNGYDGDLYISNMCRDGLGYQTKRKYIKVRGEWQLVSDKEFNEFFRWAPVEIQKLLVEPARPGSTTMDFRPVKPKPPKPNSPPPRDRMSDLMGGPDDSYPF